MSGEGLPAAAQRPPDRMEIPESRAILDYARRLGWRRALYRGAYVAANQLVTISVFDCFHLGRAEIRAELARTDADFECRFLEPGEASRFAGQLDGSLASYLPDAMARGDQAYVILDRERLASIGLYAAGPAPLLEDLVVQFEPPARYMYRGYTLAPYRGLRLHALGIVRAALELFEQGVPQLVTLVERTNYPATISVHRMGWRPSGALFRFGAGPWTRLGRTATARALGMKLSLVPSKRA